MQERLIESQNESKAFGEAMSNHAQLTRDVYHALQQDSETSIRELAEQSAYITSVANTRIQSLEQDLQAQGASFQEKEKAMQGELAALRARNFQMQEEGSKLLQENRQMRNEGQRLLDETSTSQSGTLSSEEQLKSLLTEKSAM